MRKRTGSVICPSCGSLVGVNDERCLTCGRRNPGMWGFTPLLRRLGNDLGFTAIVTVSCFVLYLLSLLLDPAGLGQGGLLNALSPSTRAVFVLGASGAIPVWDLGRWWTLLSAGWLHGSPLHLLFNLLWVRHLAPECAEAYGPARTVIIYTVASVAGFALSSTVGHFLPFLPSFLGGARITIGASAPIFGLLGALVWFGRRRGSSQLGTQALTYAVILGLYGFLMRGIDNWAHLGGFLGGLLAARALDPWKEERTDHMIVALLCLLAVLAALLGSAIPGVRALLASPR
jgi:rhomboid protease GluP